MRINNPFPSNLEKEADKAAKVLASFIGSTSVLSANQVIPPNVLANAKGLAVLTVVKAAFLGSGRFGSGIVVARLPDGSWSAPSAVGTIGAGLGGQIGFELTDFVFILNDASAVRTFTQAGNLTFGGNASIAAGPIGRNAEAAGSANLKGVAAIFAYSKTKGLFAGVSLEGGGMIERRDENQRTYGQNVTSEKILTGQVVVSPDRFYTLNQVLHSSGFNHVPTQTGPYGLNDEVNNGYHQTPGHAQTWQPGPRDSGPGGESNSYYQASHSQKPLAHSSAPQNDGTAAMAGKKVPPPMKPKPRFSVVSPNVGPNQAIAKFTFKPAEPGDLGFSKGDVITIVTRTDKSSDWWTGRIGDRQGIFPSNYVQIGS